MVCLDETVSYTCIAASSDVQWIVEPFIPATGQDAVTFSKVLRSVGTVIRRNGLVVEHLSLDPFRTRLSIEAGVINSSTNVICSTIGLTNNSAATLQYISDGEYQ